MNDSAVKEKERARVVRDQDLLVNALLAGRPADRIRDRMAQFEMRQNQLEAKIAAGAAVPCPTRLHPRIVDTYHERVATLIAALKEADFEGEAKDAIRGLIGRVVVTSVAGTGKRPVPRIDLQSCLTGILALS